MSPEVSVIVPTYRRPERLEQCLRMLLCQTLRCDRFEIIIADDAADPGTERVARSVLGDRVAWTVVPVYGRHGPAAARNAGARRAASVHLAFTDDDCLPTPAWLAEGLQALRQGADAVFGHTRVPLGPVPSDYEMNASGLERAGFITANCFVRREAFVQVRGFDERFQRAWREDTDFFFSLLEAGLHVMEVPAALIVHPVTRASWGISIRQQRNNLFDALLFKKHPRLFEAVIGRTTPWRYYVIVFSAIASVLAHGLGNSGLAVLFLIIFLALTLQFFLQRVRNTSHAPADLAEMAFTSLVIPFVAVYWRIAGALKFRSLYP